MNTLFGITFRAPENNIYCLLLVAMLAVLIYRWYRTAQIIKMLGKTVNGRRFLHNSSLLRITIKNIMWALALIPLFLVLLHPSWNKKEEIVIQEGRDLFIALDISRSMLAQDILPSRLEFAKSQICSLVNMLHSDRIGLILFSGSSFVQCPLTSDKAAFRMFLDQIDVDTIASGATALDQALAQAINAFKQSGTQKNKLLVIFTDGEDFSHNLAVLKQEALNERLTIFTVGIGTIQGAPIPTFDLQAKQSGHLRDAKGAVVISHLNEPVLQALAQDVGGTYFKLDKSSNNLDQLINLIQKREKEKIEERTFSQLIEQYPIFLVVSFILLAIEWLL
jgi:Ca-activated chloride channel family protein